MDNCKIMLRHARYRKNRIMAGQNGLTMIEIIMTLVIAGMLAAVAGIVNLSSGFVAARQNTAVAQKVQLALTRIVKELSECNSVSTTSSNTTQIAFEPRRAAGSDYSFSWSGTVGDPLILDTGGGNQDALIDNVKDFNLQYVTYNAAGTKVTSNTPSGAIDELVEVSLTSNTIGGMAFTVEVALKKHLL